MTIPELGNHYKLRYKANRNVVCKECGHTYQVPEDRESVGIFGGPPDIEPDSAIYMTFYAEPNYTIIKLTYDDIINIQEQ